MVSPSTHIEAHVGNVSGGSQVAIGNYIVQIGRVEGGVVNILNEAPPPPRVRPQPVLLRPKPFLNLLDRETETTTVLEALKSQQSVECTGEAGAGKTSLLRHLAHQTQLTTVFPAGVVYFEVNQQSAADLLKSIFDAFYICDFPIKPNETEIRHYLQSVSALVLLDDVEIDAKQIESLMNVAPNCTFVAVTRERALFGETIDVTLKGLPTADAVHLFRNELRRTLSAEEEKSAQIICESVACIPLLILRAAHEARAKNRSLLDIVSESKLAPGDQRLVASEINSSSEDEKKALAALAVFSGARVAAEHVAAVAGLSNAEPLLEDLERRGLVQSHEQQYALASDLKAAQFGNLKHWFSRALVYFVDWTKERRNQHKLIAGSAAAILLLLKQAVAAQAWSEVISLGHAVEEALTVSGKWDMWATVLNHINTAARAQGDIAKQAWVLHQLGTRALLLGDRGAARTNLTNALDIRERLNDVSGAAVTRHNLNILLAPLPPRPEDNSSNGGGGDGGTTPAWLKIGVLSLVSLAVVTILLLVGLFWKWKSEPPVVPPKIASFSVNPLAIPANGEAQLCYEVENADSVRIEPNIGERKPASKECLSVTPSETLTYTLTAYAADGTTTSQTVTLNVEPLPAQAEIVQFRVDRQDGPGGPNDVQFRLCYEVRNAAHAEIDNNGGSVVLNRPHCQPITPQQTTTYTLSATGPDGRTVTRQAIADATKLPAPPPQIVSFEAPERVIQGNAADLCFQLKDASSAQIEPGPRRVPIIADRQCIKVTPLERTTYTLRAFNSEGLEKSENRTIAVDNPPKLKHAQILFFKVSPSRIQRGASVELCYGVADAQTTTISPFGKEFPSVAKQCFKDSPKESVMYTLSTKGEDNQTSTASQTVEVEKPVLPPVRITRFEINLTKVHGTQLCYALENARSARIDPGIGELQNLTADCPRLPTLKQQTYTLTVTGFDGNTITDTRTYTPPSRPDVQLPAMKISFFRPETQTIKPGGRARICYRTTLGEGTAEISPQPGSVPAPMLFENCITVAPRETTVYTLTVGRGNERDSRRVTVVVDREVVIP
jgi:NB-ARC domain